MQREPAEIAARNATVARVHRRQRPNCAGRKYHAPRNGVRSGCGRPETLLNQVPFRLVYLGVLNRSIPIPEEPNHSPGKPKDVVEEKGGPPAKTNQAYRD